MILPPTVRAAASPTTPTGPTALGWPAWRRMLAMVPALALLWCGVWWATGGPLPW